MYNKIATLNTRQNKNKIKNEGGGKGGGGEIINYLGGGGANT